MRRILVIPFLICSLVVNAADRYLVGTGSRNWNDTANWSTTSGGSGGASVPTSADNVFFDANSGTGTVTVNAIANMLDLTFGTISAITLSNAAYAFNVYGSLTLPASNLTVSFTSTGYLYFKSTSTGKTITSNGCATRWNRVYFDGVGGGWTLQDHFTITNTSSLYVANGTFNTNNQTLTVSNLFRTEGGITNLGSSIVNASYMEAAGASSTLNSGTSTINVDVNGLNVSTASKTFYNVKIEGTSNNTLVCFFRDSTFNNLTLICGSFISSYAQLNSGCTVNGTLTLTGNNSTNYRLLVASNAIGTARTITCNGTITASNVDFRDITGAGSASWNLSAITGGSGDCGGNSGITFTTAQKQYFKHTTGSVSFSNSQNWRNSSGDLLGSELVTNGTFSSNVSGWTSSANYQITWVSGELQLTTDNAGGFLYQEFSVTPFKVYAYSFYSRKGTIGFLKYRVRDITNAQDIISATIFPEGNNTFYFITPAGCSTLRIYLASDIGSGGTSFYDNVSVREVTNAGRVPLPQDDWDMDASSFTGTSTVSVNCPRIGKSCDMSGVNQSVTWSLANAIECYGSYVLGSNITPSGNQGINLNGRNNFVISTLDKTCYRISINSAGGTYSLTSNLRLNYPGDACVFVSLGTLDFNDFDYTGYGLQSVSGANAIYMGNGIYTNIQANNGRIIDLATSTSFYCEGSTIKINTPSSSNNILFYGNGKTFNKVQFSGSHTGNFDIQGSNTFAELIIDAGRKVRVTAGTTQNIGKLTAVGTAGNLITLTSVTAAQHTLNYTGAGKVSCDYLNLSYSNATQTNTFYAGANSTNSGNNTNWIFTAPPTTGPKWNGITYSKFNGVMVKKINGK